MAPALTDRDRLAGLARGRADRRSALAGLGALALCVLVVALGGCRSTPATGTLELRWVLPPTGADGLRNVEIAPAWAGANRGRVRDANWTRIPLVGPMLRLPARDGSLVTAARGVLPAGHYDRVFVAAPEVHATGSDGARRSLASHIEPIARGFDLSPGAAVTIDIELIVLPSSSAGDGRPEIFVKDARLAGGAIGAPSAVP